MTETFSAFDAAKYLTSDEAIAEYLKDCADSNDPAVMVVALGTIARARSMSVLARDTGMTREGLYKSLSPTGNPSFATINKVAGALGFRLAFEPNGGKPSSPVKSRPRAVSKKPARTVIAVKPMKRVRLVLPPGKRSAA